MAKYADVSLHLLTASVFSARAALAHSLHSRDLRRFESFLSLDLLRRDGDEELDFRFFFFDFSCFVLSISFSMGPVVVSIDASWRMKKKTKKCVVAKLSLFFSLEI